MPDRSGHVWPDHRPQSADLVSCERCGAQTGTYAARLGCPGREEPAPATAQALRLPPRCQVCLKAETAHALRTRVRVRPSGEPTVLCVGCLEALIGKLQGMLRQMLDGAAS